MKKVLLPILFLALFFSGCIALKTSTPDVARIPAKFDFTPPSRAKVGSASLTIALVKTSYVQKDAAENLMSPYSDMASHMAEDFKELLTAKGFTVRGPFDSRDRMTYNDKLSTDIAVTVNIDLKRDYNRKYKYDPGMGVILPANYKMSGQITLSPTLNIIANSPQYGELIWEKNISLDPVNFTYTGTLKWANIPEWPEELKQDNEVYNAFSKELDTIYLQALELAWQQIDLAEMKSVADQAKKADKKN
jgi:hypothetical protein